VFLVVAAALSVALVVAGAQGCSAARRQENGVVVLDFGKPAFERGGYGTVLFDGRFATNHRVTRSNYRPAVPSAYEAGVRWARETNKLGVG
jgi:hypothetical protein